MAGAGSERLARGEAVSRRRYAWRWSRLGIAVLIVAAGFALLRRVDPAIAPIVRWTETLSEDGFGDQIFEGFKNFAQPLTIGAALTLVALLDGRRKRILIALLAAQLGANVTYSLAKFAVGRDRPFVALARVEVGGDLAAVNTWRGYRLGNTSRDYQSFPSGHSAAAFALAGVLAWYYPRASALFWLLAAGCAFSRVMHAAHWPSDCIVGAGIGYVWSQIGLRIAR